MAHYSAEFKANLLAKLLPPNNQSISALSKETGIGVSTLYNWRKQAKLKGLPVPGSRPTTSEDWDSASKLSVIIETASLNQAQLSEYCRHKGLYPEQIERWKQAVLSGLSESSPVRDIHDLKSAKKQIKGLEKELRRKDKALAEAAALLVLQKKYNALWEDEAE